MLHYPALWLPNINSSVINPQPTTFPLHDLNLRFQNRSHTGMLQVLFNAFLLRFEQHDIRPVPNFDTLFPTGTFENQETFFFRMLGSKICGGPVRTVSALLNLAA